jgi:uncharacterized protein
VSAGPLRVGLCADTHGLLRPALVEALRGCATVLHAGDVGGEAVLAGLRALAPLHAVRGNNDPPGCGLPRHLDLALGGHRLHLVHDRADASPGPADLVVFGHSHRPCVERREHRLWINPGSAGPRRFRLPVQAAILHLGAGDPRVEVLDLLA